MGSVHYFFVIGAEQLEVHSKRGFGRSDGSRRCLGKAERAWLVQAL